MDRVLHFVLALVVVTALALLVSHDRKKKSASALLFSFSLLKFCSRGSS